MLGLRLALIEKKRGNREQALQQLDQYFAAKTTSADMLPYQVLEELLAGTNAAATDSPPETAAAAAQSAVTGQAQSNSPRMIRTICFWATSWLTACGPPLCGTRPSTQYRAMLAVESTADGHQGLVEIFIHQQQLAPLLEQLGEVVGQTGSLAPLDTSIDPLVKDPELLEQLAGVALAQIAQVDHRPIAGRAHGDGAAGGQGPQRRAG